MLPQVTFRGLLPSAEIIEIVCRKANKLTDVEPQLRGCHVVIEASPRGRQRPISNRVTVHRSGGTGAGLRKARHTTDENLHVALRDVFRATLRQLVIRDKRARGPSQGLTIN